MLQWKLLSAIFENKPHEPKYNSTQILNLVNTHKHHRRENECPVPITATAQYCINTIIDHLRKLLESIKTSEYNNDYHTTASKSSITTTTTATTTTTTTTLLTSSITSDTLTTYCLLLLIEPTTIATATTTLCIETDIFINKL
jgi:hypothetical protein